jgi:hypothetical protein
MSFGRLWASGAAARTDPSRRGRLSELRWARCSGGFVGWYPCEVRTCRGGHLQGKREGSGRHVPRPDRGSPTPVAVTRRVALDLCPDLADPGRAGLGNPPRKPPSLHPPGERSAAASPHATASGRAGARRSAPPEGGLDPPGDETGAVKNGMAFAGSRLRLQPRGRKRPGRNFYQPSGSGRPGTVRTRRMPGRRHRPAPGCRTRSLAGSRHPKPRSTTSGIRPMPHKSPDLV